MYFFNKISTVKKGKKKRKNTSSFVVPFYNVHKKITLSFYILSGGLFNKILTTTDQ